MKYKTYIISTLLIYCIDIQYNKNDFVNESHGTVLKLAAFLEQRAENTKICHKDDIVRLHNTYCVYHGS